jgi:hypothetical protein
MSSSINLREAAMQGSREEVAEYFYEKASNAGMDKSGVGIHEVSNPDKQGKGSHWLSMFLYTEEHQTEIKVYGAHFIQFKVWRPFMGKDTGTVNILFKTVASASRFFNDSLVGGFWTGKLAH